MFKIVCVQQHNTSLQLSKYNKLTFFFLCLCISLYICLFARSKIVEHRKEEKYASMGDEYSYNFTN